MSGRGILFLSANTPWVFALADCVAAHAPVTAVRFYDLANYLRHKPTWPGSANRLRQVSVTMPPGYAGRFERAFRPVMRALVGRERARLRRAAGGAEPVVVAPYPYAEPWIRDVPSSALVYYNLDDYDLYDPSRVARTRALEDALIARAGTTLCLSVHQVERLSARNPAHAGRIHHFPLGVVDAFLNPAPGAAPLPATVGYVGNLGDRVDWPLVAETARLLPDVTFHVVGFLSGPSDIAAMNAWQRARAEALGLKNVVYEGGVPQEKVAEHYWRYAVNWMPYATDHPFNRAACPTKIMDALASGRPFVSTDVPEVRLYPDRIAVADGAGAAAAAIRRALDAPPDPAEQVAFARRHTWPHRAETFLSLVGEAAARPAAPLDA